MFAEIIESYLRTLTPADVTDVFLMMIGVVFILAFLQAAFIRHSQFLEHAPSLMTALGILGTFVGIVIGLLDFDPKQIDESISTLLDGLKTAFLTSLVGMAAAILFKAFDSWFFAPLRSLKKVKQDITPRDIYQSMQDNNELVADLKNAIAGTEEGSLVGQTKLLRSDVSDLKSAIAGSEEGSLVGQTKLLRGEFNDFRSETNRTREEFNKKLWSELENFAEMMSKSATEQVIEALRQVIVEFNQKLTEQFGDNFKRLDESVKKLVDWQAQYMQQMAEMSEHYAEGVKAIDSTREAVGNISDSAEEIPKSMDKLRDVLEVNQHQIAELQRHLEAFVQMREKAVDAVPQIKQQITDIGAQLTEGAEEMKIVLLEGATNFKESVTQTNASMNEMATTVSGQSENIASTLKDTSEELNTKSRDMLQRLTESSSEIQKQLQETVRDVMAGIQQDTNEIAASIKEQITNSIRNTDESVNGQLLAIRELQDTLGNSSKEMQGRIESAIESVVTSIGQTTDKMISGVREHINTTVSRTEEAVNEQVGALDQALQQELNRSMENLGQALATIAQHIVDTYESQLQSSAYR